MGILCNHFSAAQLSYRDGSSMGRPPDSSFKGKDSPKNKKPKWQPKGFKQVTDRPLLSTGRLLALLEAESIQAVNYSLKKHARPKRQS